MVLIYSNTKRFPSTSQNKKFIMSGQRRLQIISGHLKPAAADVTKQECAASNATVSSQKDQFSKFPGRHGILKWNGWGYGDSQFSINDSRNASFTGSRYILSGQTFPKLVDWFLKECHTDLDIKSLAKPLPDATSLPKPIINEAFLDCIKQSNIPFTFDAHMRLFHGHGHTSHEIFELRHGMLKRIPDIVVWPSCHTDVEEIVKAASRCNVCVIPYGGGTSVSSALECPPEEQRMIVSLDTTEMKRILWVDEVNLVAHIEAGIIGQDLEQQVSLL